MNKKVIVLFSIFLTAVIAIGSYLGFNSTRPTPKVVQSPQTVSVSICDVQQSVAAPGRLINTQTSPVGMPTDGQLSEILVRPGQNVSQGQLLARMANLENLAAQAASAELETLQAQETLDALTRNAPARKAQLKVDLLAAQDALKKAQEKRTALAQPRAQGTTLEQAEGELVMAQDAYQQALNYYQSVSELEITNPERMAAVQMLAAAKQQYERSKANLAWYQGTPGAAELAKADADVELAKANAAAAQAALDRLKNGLDPISEAQAKNSLAQAQAKLAKARQVQQSGEILAPFSGVVIEINAQVGEPLQVGAAILTLSNPQALQVKATVTQEDYPLIKVGQAVELYFDARADLTMHGKIESIIPKRIEGDRPLYNIFINLDETPLDLVDGMTTDSAITIAQQAGVLCLPRAVVRASGSNSVTVQVWDGVQILSRQIEIGLRGDAYVEIKTGLKEGERVVTK